MKKILLTLGSIAAVAMPIISVVSCGNETTKENKPQVSSLQTVTHKDHVTVNVRIPDWDHKEAFDQALYNSNPSNFIRYWEGTEKIAKMVPYYTVHHFVEEYKPEKLGDLLDQINQRTHVQYFKWNATKENAGKMGRFLTGILKGNKNPDSAWHNAFYGMKEVQTNGVWKTLGYPDYSDFFSLASTTNSLSKNALHDDDQVYPTTLGVDNGLSLGCDSIDLEKNDVIDITLWK